MNIYDIAEQCGVSIATVSRVLNNNPNVSAATRAKIQAVIDAAGFTPSAVARNLGNGAVPAPSSGITGGIGVVCAGVEHPFEAELLSMLEAELRQRNHTVLLKSGCTTAQQVQTALQELADSGVSAILYLNPLCDATFALTPSVPVILLEGQSDATNVYSVASDRQRAAAELVDLLMRRQRRRILFLYSRMTQGCRQALEGFKAAYEKAGVPVDDQLIVQVDSRPEDVNTCIKRLLVNRVTFDAVIGAEDLLALGAQKSLSRTGLSMPVIGFNNSLVARCATPELTSVDCDTAGQCADALDILAHLLESQEAPRTVTRPTKLMERDTFRNV